MHTPILTHGMLLLPRDPHFMTDIARVSVLRRALLNGAKAGIHSWLILTYTDPDIVRDHLAGETRLRQITYEIVNLNAMTPDMLQSRLPQGEVIAISCTALFDAQVLLALQDQCSPTLGVHPIASDPQNALDVNLPGSDQTIAAAGLLTSVSRRARA